MGYLILSCLSSFWKTATLGQWGGGEGGNLESFVKYRVALNSLELAQVRAKVSRVPAKGSWVPQQHSSHPKPPKEPPGLLARAWATPSLL